MPVESRHAMQIKSMILNDCKLAITREQISCVLDSLARLRAGGRSEELALLAGGWRAKLNRVDRENSGCGCALFGLFFFAGCGSLVMLVWGFLRVDWRANNRYLPNSCVVLDRRLATEMGGANPDGGLARPTYHPEIKIRYEVDGRNYEVWAYDAIFMFYPDRAAQQAIVDSFQIGAAYPYWYDPDRPEKAILVRGHAWAPYIVLVVPIVFLIIGGVGLHRSWKNLRTMAHHRGLERALQSGAGSPGAGPDQTTVPVLDLSQSPGALCPIDCRAPPDRAATCSAACSSLSSGTGSRPRSSSS
jgi:hypothetical protein